MKFRISRPCYDKFHRCPGWNGGGPRYAKVKSCDGGHIQVDYDDKWWKWKFWPCDKCNVVVLPYHASKLSIKQLTYFAKWKYEDWQYERSWRK